MVRWVILSLQCLRSFAVPLLLQIRESIKSLFPNRECFALVRPMADEKQLQRLESVPPEQMRPEFREVQITISAHCECIELTAQHAEVDREF